MKYGTDLREGEAQLLLDFGVKLGPYTYADLHDELVKFGFGSQSKNRLPQDVISRFFLNSPCPAQKDFSRSFGDVTAEPLSHEQVNYAVRDTVFAFKLLLVLWEISMGGERLQAQYTRRIEVRQDGITVVPSPDLM